MKKAKKILAMVLAVIMMIGAVPVEMPQVYASSVDEITDEAAEAVDDIQTVSGEEDVVEEETVDEEIVDEDTEQQEAVDDSLAEETESIEESEEPAGEELQEEPIAALAEDNASVPAVTAAVQNSYDKVNSVTAGDNYVIVYKYNNKYYALTWDGSFYQATEGTVSNSTFTPVAPVEEASILWNYSNRAFTLASNGTVKVSSNGNSGDIQSAGRYNLSVNDNNQLRTKSISYRRGYLSYNGSKWIVSTSSNNYFTFYQKVTKVNLTVNWYVDGKLVSGPTTTPVTAGKDTTVTKPDAVSGMNLIKYVINGTEHTTEITEINISEDTTIDFYYTDPNVADDLLYPDDITSGEEIPQYPDQGAVRINKTATSDDFNGTGVAKVELGTTGVPMKKGVDVVLVFDVSTSMTDKISGSDRTKLEDAQEAACNFVDKLLADNADGTKSNNRVGLVTFAGYNNGAGNKIEYPLKNANAKENIKTTIKGLRTYSGTDYDFAFSGANTVLNQAAEGRDTFVVFMTDGAPSTYNGHKYNKSKYKTNYVLGNALNNAETVKGAPINATVYSIGFGVSQGNNVVEDEDYDCQFTGDECKQVLQKIATDDAHYVPADNSEQLTKAFNDIATSIKKAGTEAVVTDQIGNLFELQKTQTLPNDKPDLQFVPTIQVTLYDLYTRAEVGQTINGKEITLNDVGTRKGTSTVVETVTFGADGKSATSSLKTGNIMDAVGNITAEKFTYTAATKIFTWNVGDITEQEATISYYVYLKGSMEGNRGDGLYDTNEYAKLNYINYKGNPTEQTFTKPKMPWGSAVVNYEFYLVNAKGKPVNSRGDVIPFENRVKIGDIKQAKFNWNNSANVEAKVEAAKFVPKGYTLHIADATYTANAVSSENGSHTITGTIPQGAEQSTIMYQTDAQYTNSFVAFGVLNKTTLIPDSVVLDYGKPVTIDVMENDMVMDAVLHSVAPNGINVGVNLGDGTTDTLVDGFGRSVDLTNGTAAEVNGKVKYTPTRYMDSIDKFLYAAEITTGSTEEGGDDIKYYRYQTVSVIPATTVYYEDNFGNTEDDNKTNGIVFSGAWLKEGTGADSEQDNGTVIGDGHPYGNDSSYKNDTVFSAGSAHVVTGTKNADTTASFTFKGTGFDIISRTDSQSTSIAIQVTDSKGKTISSKKVDNMYKSGTLYQIPVYEWRSADYDLIYGEYTVTIIVGQSGTANTFYLDAIRIYDPIDPDGDDAAEAEEKYLEDKEANAVITELRRMLLEQYAEGTLTGLIYVDGINTTSVGTYENIGPNNEIYLKKGQSIGLAIKTTGDPASVQLGAKAPNGAVSFKVGSDIDADREITLNTATDMYYDISDSLNFVVSESGEKTANMVVTNTSAEEDVILSLTNLKVTYGDSGMSYSLFVDEAVVENTFAVVNARLAVIEEPEEPEIPEEPETPDEPETPEKPDENPGKDFIEDLYSFIKDIFGKWF